MTFNVENLFDTQHDLNKDDYTFLPQALKETKEVQNACNQQRSPHYRRQCMDLNWTDEILDKKISNIKQVLLQVDGGKGPDILVLVEVENDKVLSRLNRQALSAAQYQSQILVEGPDPRGIDMAMLSRFPTEGPPVLHRIPFHTQSEKDQGRDKTLRGILEVTFVLPDKTKLTVFANHFPSPSNPGYWRAQYVEFLRKLIVERSAKNPVIAAGDLNITADEEAGTGYFRDRLGSVALVPHLEGCDQCPRGSHNYRGSWSFLDAILLSKDLGPQGKARWKMVPGSFQVPRSQSVHLMADGRPMRFDEESGTGVSDHFPLYIRLAPRN